MLILNEADIISAVDINDLLLSIEQAIILQERGEFQMPDRMHLSKGENVFLLMPALADDYFGTKIVSVFPRNIKQKKPSIYGSLILNDGESGEPLAIMNGAKLTALRTGAIGAMGVLYTTPTQSKTLGIIGLGMQGFHQVICSCAVRNIEHVFIFDPYINDMNKIILDMKNFLPDINFTRCSSATELVEKSEIIITATTSSNPVIPNDSDLLSRKHFIGIGSFKPEMQEYPDALFSQLDHVFVDTIHAKTESGDISARLEKGLIGENQIYTLGKLIEREITINDNNTSFFKSVGMALFDLKVAIKIYRNKQKKKLGTLVNL